MIGRGSAYQVELGYVRAGRQVDSYRIMRSVIGIINAQTFADLSGFDADRGIVAGIVAGWPAEDLDADGALLEHVAMALERVFHHVTEEILATFAGSEFVRREDAAQFLADLFLGHWRGLTRVLRRHWRNIGLMSLRHQPPDRFYQIWRPLPKPEIKTTAFGRGN